jgi:hypothetical protein
MAQIVTFSNMTRSPRLSWPPKTVVRSHRVITKPAPRNEMPISINCTPRGRSAPVTAPPINIAIGASRIHSVNFWFTNVART